MYLAQIQDMVEEPRQTFFVDYAHFAVYHPDASNVIRVHFARLEPYLSAALLDIVSEHFQGHERDLSAQYQHQATRRFSVSFYNLPEVLPLRQLSPEFHTGRLVSVQGTVTRVTAVRPELASGFFTCLNPDCQSTVPNVPQNFTYTKPRVCPNPRCSNRTQWSLDEARSSFVDHQRAILQESADENLAQGSTPVRYDIILRNDLVNRVSPGQRVVLTGALVPVPDVTAFSTRPDGPQRVTRVRVNGADVAIATAAINEPDARHGSGRDQVQGVKTTPTSELRFKLAFVATHVRPVLLLPGGPAAAPGDAAAGVGEHVRRCVDKDYSGGLLTMPPLFVDPQDSPTDVRSTKTEDAIAVEAMSSALRARCAAMAADPAVYPKLVNSFAPFIYGHAEIKRAILLQLVGGVAKHTSDGMTLRGDINVLVVGDPSTGKSQLLRHATLFHPRSVYTSGKTSTAAGLTAAVVKDPETGEWTIEAGAMMLADNGLCAIDEFEKMDMKDQVAIHEAMEQQSISISKAGINATLNARASVLAAMNPVGGRYDKSRPLRHNVNISPPILSRFDLFFVVHDDPDVDLDRSIADALFRSRDAHFDADLVSEEARQPYSFRPPFTTEELVAYIRMARLLVPVMTPEAAQVIVDQYVALRQRDVTETRHSFRMTTRQLEALTRVAEAVARLHMSLAVTPAHAREAARLVQTASVKLDAAPVTLDDDAAGADTFSPATASGSVKPEPEAVYTTGSTAVTGPVDDFDFPQDVEQPERPAKRAGGTVPGKKREPIKITSDKYYTIVRRAVTLLRARASLLLETDPVPGESREDSALPKSRIVLQLMAEAVSNGEVEPTEDGRAHERRVIELVLDRLVKKDHVLAVVKTVETETGSEPALVVHPLMEESAMDAFWHRS
jgi:DNA replication licensing factor MCM6